MTKPYLWFTDDVRPQTPILSFLVSSLHFYIDPEGGECFDTTPTNSEYHDLLSCVSTLLVMVRDMANDISQVCHRTVDHDRH